MWVKYIGNFFGGGTEKKIENLKIKYLVFKNRDLKMGLSEHEGSILTL